jgi:hypothetical protein
MKQRRKSTPRKYGDPSPGTRFGSLTVLSVGFVDFPNGQRKRYIYHRCDCGGEARSMIDSLLRRVDKGLDVVCKRCSAVRSGKKAHECTITHGHTRGGEVTPEWLAWRSMCSRCLRPGDPSYPRYGGRGITICERWRDSAAFIADMGPKPCKSYSLDRIDNSKGYCPENCRWATPTEQTRNRSNSVKWTFRGETLSPAEWSARLGIKACTLEARVRRYGWTIEQTLSSPIQH